MIDDYKVNGTKGKLSCEVEQSVLDCLAQMSSKMRLSESELVNTALRRFIATHKDFLPAGFKPEAEAKRNAS
jgi:hypothetical protein